MEIRCWRSCLIAVAGLPTTLLVTLLMASGSAQSATLMSAPQSVPQNAAFAAPPNAPLSERVVAYQIEGRYNAKTHTLDATELLTYTNNTGVQLDTFPFPSVSECVPAEIDFYDRSGAQRTARRGEGRRLG